MGWGVSRSDNCAVEELWEVWEEELNRKGENDAGWSRTWREGERKLSTGDCGKDPARERVEGGEGALEAAEKRIRCLLLGFRLLAVQCCHVSLGKVAAQLNGLYEWCLQEIKGQVLGSKLGSAHGREE